MRLFARIRSHQHWLILTLLVLAVFVAYGRSLWQDFAPIDDTLLVRENLFVRGFTVENLRYVFTHYDPEIYIPLTFVSYQLNYMLGGLQPFGFHLINILLHAANAVLVFFLLRILFVCSGKPWVRQTHHGRLSAASQYLPAIGALLFAVHPLHAEAVVWIAGRKDLLFTFFYLLTLVIYLRSRSLTSDEKRATKNTAWYLLSLAFALCAMLSKAMAITLPITLMLLDWFERACHGERNRTIHAHNMSPIDYPSTMLRTGARDDTSMWRVVFNKIPFFLLSAAFAFVAMGGKERVVGSTSAIDIALIALRSTAHYLGKIVLPVGLSVFYQHRGPITLLDPRFAGPFIVLIALCAAAWYLRKRAPWFGFGFLFYLVTLSPTFLNFNKGLIAFYAVDRYAYLPSVGIVFVVMMGIHVLCRFLPQPTRSPSSTGGGGRGVEVIASGVALITFIGFIILSNRQTRVWDSPASLYSHAVAVDPASVPARATLAQVLRQLGQSQEAFAILKEGLQYGDDVSYHLEAGNIYAANGQVADAIQEFVKVLQMKPDLPEPYLSIGFLEEHRGNTDLALEYYKQALGLDPSYVGARVRIADILIDRGELVSAEEQLTEALRWNPSYFSANVQMYRLRMGQGREEEAQLFLDRARALRPGEELNIEN